MYTKIDITIIIVNYNTKDLLLQSLRSLYQNTRRFSFEVVIIDNNSLDGSIEAIRKEFPQVNLIENKANVGFAKANNQGFEAGKGKYYLLLNPDTKVLPGAIDLIIEFMEKDNSIGITGPKLLGADYSIQDSCKKFPTIRGEFLQSIFLEKILPGIVKSRFGDYVLRSKVPINVDWITGACLAIRRKVVEDIGKFDEHFFLYYEEVDFCYRAKKKGWKILFLPNAQVIHYSGQSTEKNLTASLIEGYKSKYYFFRKYYTPEKVAFIRRFAVLGLFIRLVIWKLVSFLNFRKEEALERVKAYKSSLQIKKDIYMCINTSSIYYSKAGVGSYTKNLFKKLSLLTANSDNFLLFNFKERTTDKNINKKNDNRNIVIRSIGAIKRMFWEQILLPFSLWLRGIDVFHSPAFICPLLKVCPTVITIHDMAYLLYPDKFINRYRQYLKFWVPLSIKAADKIITDSICSKKDIVRLLNVPEGKIEVVYLGKSSVFQPISDKLLIDSFKQKYNLKRNFILYLGTLEPRKNVTGLINAYRLFKNMFPRLDYALVIGGAKGWLYSDIFKMVKEFSLTDDIAFLGYVPENELPVLYNAAKLFVYPSLYEGFGLPVLEAMACGVPVISSNTSSLPEIIQDAGIMIDPLDVHALAIEMQRILADNNLRDQMRKKGLKRAADFSWEKTAAETVEIYKRIITKKNRDRF